MFIPIYHSKTLLSIIHGEIGFICIQVSVLIQENELMCLLAQSVLPPTFYDLTTKFRIFSDIVIFKKKYFPLYSYNENSNTIYLFLTSKHNNILKFFDHEGQACCFHEPALGWKIIPVFVSSS